VQSVAQASFDAWIKYYRPDENTPNITVSYYGKGALVALALDLSLRQGDSSLDAVMRHLWTHSSGGPISEADIVAAVRSAGGAAVARELEQWVHGVRELPLPRLLQAAAVSLHDEEASFAAALGLRLSEGPVTGVQVKSVAPDGAAAKAGVSAGDELLAVNGWRIRRLDEALLWTAKDKALELLLVRDRRVRIVTLRAEPRSPLRRQLRLGLDDGASAEALARRRAWLGT
jgi:predicted metalloprotease with PDZ domain